MLTVPEQQKTEPLQRVGLLFYYFKLPFTTLQGTCPADTDTSTTTTYIHSQVVSAKRFIQRKKERETRRSKHRHCRDIELESLCFGWRNCEGRVLEEIKAFCQLEDIGFSIPLSVKDILCGLEDLDLNSVTGFEIQICRFVL